MPLALYTFGQFIEPAEDKANNGFHELNDPVFQTADNTPGLIARSGYASGPGPDSWGQEVYPEFYKERGDGWSPATLSLWEDMEALFAFTYFGLHAEALKRGSEWFQKPEWPLLVLWWHNAASVPTWTHGVERHRNLHDHGAEPYAFTFKQPFDEHGNTTKLDKHRVQFWRQAARDGA